MSQKSRVSAKKRQDWTEETSGLPCELKGHSPLPRGCPSLIPVGPWVNHLVSLTTQGH